MPLLCGIDFCNLLVLHRYFFVTILNCSLISATTERVCLIMGSVDSVRKVHNFIMEKIREKPDPNPKLDGEAKSNFERHKQVIISFSVVLG